jgi:rhamnogalacturonyl hydrolase YesR
MPRCVIRVLGACAVAALALVDVRAQAPPDARTPLEIARVLAMRYPAAVSMSYIPAVAWAGALRITALTGEPQFANRAREQMQVFLTGAKPAIAEPYQLTSLAGHLAFVDLYEMEGVQSANDLAVKAADFILPADGGNVRFARRWTDDMFMASALLSRAGARTKDPKYAAAVGRLLTSYAESLQRPDGLFIHALDGPHAWGRGNGFAALGLADALLFLPEHWSDRARVLDIFRRHMAAMRPHQSDDGTWRQVVDEPGSYRELTVTAMTLAAMARGVRLGWLDASFRPIIDKAWQGVRARVSATGEVADVCSSTGAGPTREYYLNRPAVSGGDDRGGAMALLAAVEMEELRRR